MSKWQPIETAPRNEPGYFTGPRILVFNAFDGISYDAYWGLPDQGAGNWIMSSPKLGSTKKESVGPNHRVTHWMPLPEPPK